MLMKDDRRDKELDADQHEKDSADVVADALREIKPSAGKQKSHCGENTEEHPHAVPVA